MQTTKPSTSTPPSRWRSRFGRRPIDRNQRVDDDGRALDLREMPPPPPPPRSAPLEPKLGWGAGRIVALAAAALGILAGVVTFVRADIDWNDLTQPTVGVFGFDHTPWLGILEIAAGAILAAAAFFRAGFKLVALVGVALMAGGAAIIGRYGWTVDNLGAERDFGWIVFAVGAAALLATIWSVTSTIRSRR